jgi:hypothetical protein
MNPEWFDDTPGNLAKKFAKIWPELKGTIQVVSTTRKARGRHAQRLNNFIFHDGIAKSKREAKKNKAGMLTANGMCFNCGFLSVNMDLYLVTGDHPDGGAILRPGKLSTVRSKIGYGYACAQCLRDNGWQTQESMDFFNGEHAGYVGDDTSKWHSIEPLPELWKLHVHARNRVTINKNRHSIKIEGDVPDDE